MKRTTIKLLLAGAVLAALGWAFWLGGGAPAPSGESPTPVETISLPATPPAPPADTAPQATPTPTAKPNPSEPPAQTPRPTAAQEPSQTPGDPSASPSPTGANPQPVEPGEGSVEETEYTCTLSVRCDTLLDNLDTLAEEKAELVPGDGILFPATQVTFYEGESVFNVLQREMKKAKIHMEFTNTPIYGSAYIEGIGNLYELDCGELSGWMYKVNDWFPNYGCSRYALQEGDVVEWVYTCDLGADVGGGEAAGGQRE